MTVKELMREVDVERVIDAFLLFDYHISVENLRDTFIEKFNAIPKLKRIIRENIRLFAECTPNKDAELYTIFIISTPNDDYEKQERNDISSFATCDAEVLQVIDKDFHIFDDKGEATISQYSFDEAPMQEMANYTIANSSLKELGKEICAAKILLELFFWGKFPEEREKAVNNLYEHISKPTDKKNLIPDSTFEEVMRKLEKQLLASMSNDEKAYHLAKKRFEKETEAIVINYQNRINNEVHIQYIKAIKQEYKNR